MPDLKHVNALSYLQLHANRTVNLTINQTKTNYIMGISNQKYLLHDKKNVELTNKFSRIRSNLSSSQSTKYNEKQTYNNCLLYVVDYSN